MADVLTQAQIDEMLKNVAMGAEPIVAAKEETKIKEYDFTTVTKQQKLPDSITDADEIYNIAYHLYTEVKSTERPIRLIGVTVGNLKEKRFENMSIYDFI